jgi:nicotinate-nucleotide adenylyltransferase
VKILRRIALYGGSFDPVHSAHVAVARMAMEQAALDRVIFLPAAQSPLKKWGPVASGALRLEMLNAALAGSSSWAEVSDWELHRPGPGYSWQSAEYFASHGNPGIEWFWLMGVDQWQQLERWQRWERLAELVTFLVFTRSGVAPFPRPGIKALFLTGAFDGSSTLVRRERKEGGNWQKWVDPAVAVLIEREKLYLDGEAITEP